MFTASGGGRRRAAARGDPGGDRAGGDRRWSSREFREFSGLDAVRRLAAEAGSWPEAAEDWQWCARFGYQVIERRGTGGGAFRLMYSRFLEEAGRPEAPLAADAAARWTELAEAFQAASESEDARAGALARDRRRRQPRRRGRGPALDRLGRFLSRNIGPGAVFQGPTRPNPAVVLDSVRYRFD